MTPEPDHEKLMRVDRKYREVHSGRGLCSNTDRKEGALMTPESSKAFSARLDTFRANITKRMMDVNDMAGASITVTLQDGSIRNIPIESPEARQIMERYCGKD